jgi:CHAD domain-containing protein
MPPEPTAFVVPPSLGAAKLIAHLEESLPGSVEAPVTERWTWWDTFDWRLHHAGLVLASTSDERGGYSLSVRPAGGVVALATARSTTPPRLVDELPQGLLRARLEPVVEMRALLPFASVGATTTVLVVRNDDEKVVVRVAVDELRTERGDDAGLWARVLPVRGYDKAAARARDALAAAGAEPAAGDIIETALATGEGARQPGDYGSKLLIELEPQQSAASAFVTALRVLLDAIEVNLPGTLADIDSEFLHDLRVAVRRSRSALKHAEDVLPDELLHCFRPELAWLQEITGPTRDLDVQLLGLPAEAAALAPGARAELEPFAALLADRQREAQEAMADALRSERARALLHDWRETLEALRETADDPTSGDAGEWGTWPEGASRSIATVAVQAIARRDRRVLKLGKAITHHTAPEALHDLRKQGKELRYLLELFGSLFPAKALGPVIKDLKQLQDNLGEFQDTEVQRHALRGFGDELVAASAPPGTILTLAQLVERLVKRQDAARAAFTECFGRFAAPASRKHIESLLDGEGSQR